MAMKLDLPPPSLPAVFLNPFEIKFRSNFSTCSCQYVQKWMILLWCHLHCTLCFFEQMKIYLLICSADLMLAIRQKTWHGIYMIHISENTSSKLHFPTLTFPKSENMFLHWVKPWVRPVGTFLLHSCFLSDNLPGPIFCLCRHHLWCDWHPGCKCAHYKHSNSSKKVNVAICFSYTD